MKAWFRRGIFSLTGKILIIYVPLAVVTVVTLLAAMAAYDHVAGVRQLRQYVAEAARVNAALLAEPIWQFKAADVATIAQGIKSSSSILSVSIRDENGKLIAQVGGPTEPPLPHDIVVAEQIFAPASSRLPDRRAIGHLVVESSSGVATNGIADKLSIGLLLLAAVIVALVAATLITMRLVIMRPLRLLEKSIATVGDEGQAIKVAWRSDDELGRIVAAYNDMIEYRTEATELLRRAKDELEERVHDRTSELEEARDRAQDATRAKANFLAAMSHEIRTPMNGIVGMVDLLSEYELDADQRKMTSTIKLSAYSLLSIIGDILDFSKLEAGRMQLEHMPLSIDEILESVGISFWPMIAERSLRMPMFCDPRIPQLVVGDQVRLRQVLNNLMGNAVKFTKTTPDKTGYVVVRADLLAQDEGRVQIRLSIADNGIGMSEEVLSRLFRPFEQADASTVRHYGGTGLGLSICKQLVTLMDGDIHVESEPDVGTTFSTDLWFDIGKAQRSFADLGGVRVLIIVEDPASIIATFLARYITDVNGVAETVHDRQACLDRLKATAGGADGFDVVVLSPRIPIEEKQALRSDIVAIPDVSPRFVFLNTDLQRTSRAIDSDTLSMSATPLSRRAFLDCVAVAVGRASPDTQMLVDEATLHPAEAPSVEEAEAAGQLILVAEDNEINREVIKRQLARLGYAGIIVADGKQALEAYRTGRYGLLLTDCHMPVMDGYQLVSEIREIEKTNGGHIPILAITANALHGEVDRCLAIGMDDFIVKPIELATFRMKLKRWIPSKAAYEAEDAAVTDDPHDDAAVLPIFDLAVLQSLVGDDPESIQYFLANFERATQSVVSEICKAHSDSSLERIAFEVHKLKSSSRTIGAMVLSQICVDLESRIQEEDWPAIGRLVSDLPGAFKDLVARLEAKRVERVYSDA